MYILIKSTEPVVVLSIISHVNLCTRRYNTTAQSSPKNLNRKTHHRSCDTRKFVRYDQRAISTIWLRTAVNTVFGKCGHARSNQVFKSTIREVPSIPSYLIILHTFLIGNWGAIMNVCHRDRKTERIGYNLANPNYLCQIAIEVGSFFFIGNNNGIGVTNWKQILQSMVVWIHTYERRVCFSWFNIYSSAMRSDQSPGLWSFVPIK